MQENSTPLPEASRAKLFVWLTKGGVMECIGSDGLDRSVEFEMVDFQNLDCGDVAPEISPEMSAMLERKAPTLLNDLDLYRTKFYCESCLREFWNIDDLEDPLKDQVCPKCGATDSIVERKG